MTKKCCEIIYWKHDQGWDAYQIQDCTEYNGKAIPKWFDCAVVESAPTKAKAKQEIKELHPLGICLVVA
tara:strand:- start:6653 stop:6859 length:207 start_codon:yes stop_codon:yes gene_type:complete